MKWWNKQTLNADGDLYASGVRSVERPADWDNPDFTLVTPPSASLNSRVPCTWDEENQVWVLNETENQIAIDRQSAIQKFINSPFNNITIEQANTYIDNNSTSLPTANEVMKKIVEFQIGLREVLREFIKK